MNEDDEEDDLILDQSDVVEQAARTHPPGDSGPTLIDVNLRRDSDANGMEKQKRLLVAVTCLSIVSSGHDHSAIMIAFVLVGHVHRSARTDISISRTEHVHSIVVHAVARDDQGARVSPRCFSQFLSLPVVRRMRPSLTLFTLLVRLGSVCAVYSVYRVYRSVSVFVPCPSQWI
jgi:hypothetical protein